MKASKNPTFIYSEGADPTTISVPQLDIQPYEPMAAVPGAPVGDSLTVQKSGVVPHWPKISQHALSGQGLRVEILTPAAGANVPGFCGPQTALGMVTGIGGAPVLRHIRLPACKSEQPIQPQVLLLKLAKSSRVRLYAAAMAEQESPATTR